MKKYISKEERDNTKTYYKYVDVLVRFEDGGKEYIEKATSTKSMMMSQIYQIVGTRKIKSIEIKDTFFRLKDKWS
tara:strand:- start:1667 stop:1891 length:225 start_codon:yes stop_codon:yes gene_type:complete